MPFGIIPDSAFGFAGIPIQPRKLHSRALPPHIPHRLNHFHLRPPRPSLFFVTLIAAMEQTQTDTTELAPPSDEARCNFTVKTAKTARTHSGSFKPGVSGNPAGRPRGSVNRFSNSQATLLARALLEERAADLTQKAISEAMEGNPIALKLCLERLIPPPQDAPVHLSFPALGTTPGSAPADIFAAHSALLSAVASGQVTPQQGQAISSLIEGRRRSWEAVELAERLNSIESRLPPKK